jgi:KDO2-lipid IV(A) lauroyltransferase
MTLGDRAQAWLLAGFLRLLRVLPFESASGITGGLARTIGPLLGTSRKARRRLERTLPGLGEAEYRRIIRGMWDNLGRVLGEYAHLDRMSCFGEGARAEVLGTEHVAAAVARGRPIVFVSGHLGNWEVGYIAARQFGLDVSPIYRAVNNEAIDALMLRIRRSTGVDPIAKGAAGARRIIAALRRNAALTILVDQKMNDGIAVPFFGRDAMTAPAAAELALRHDAALLPARVERVGRTRFRVTVEPALALPRTGDRHADIAAAMAMINQRLEAWIRERPEQWFWLHRRWPDD